jgi:hypothetical protein
LLDVGRVAAEHPRETGEILTALGTETLKDDARV